MILGIGFGSTAVLIRTSELFFLAAVAVVSFFCAWELSGLQAAPATVRDERRVHTPAVHRIRFGVAAAAIGAGLPSVSLLDVSGMTAGGSRAVEFGAVALLVAGPVVWLAAPTTESEARAARARIVGRTTGGLLYCGVLPAYLALLKLRDPSGGSVLLALAIAWGGDVGGYLVGRSIGRRPLWSRLSPRKTVEGVAGALAAGLFAAMLVRGAWPIDISVRAFLPIALGAQLLAQGGDLFESALTRRYGARDSSRLLADQGGVLDVMDGTLFVAPWLYYLLRV